MDAEQQVQEPVGEDEAEVQAVPAEDGEAAQAQIPANPDQQGAQPQPPAEEQAGMDVLARLANALERVGG